jgi:hypothetical protein
MAGTTVLKRTVFVERTPDGVFRFADWALATTTLGTMAEPFCPNLRRAPDQDIQDFDFADDMSLITSIEAINSDLLPTMLSSGGPVTIGGNLMPRVGR